MAQFVLDCFPDCISQYGLLGCATVPLALISLISFTIGVRRLWSAPDVIGNGY